MPIKIITLLQIKLNYTFESGVQSFYVQLYVVEDLTSLARISTVHIWYAA
jgi:hypothetical protein